MSNLVLDFRDWGTSITWLMQKQFLGKMRWKKECSITRFHIKYSIINSWLNFKLDVWENIGSSWHWVNFELRTMGPCAIYFWTLPRWRYVTSRAGTSSWAENWWPPRSNIWQWWAKWRLSTFDLYPWGEGNGAQGQICDILRPQLAMNRFLPLWLHRFPHFVYIHLGGGAWGALILDRSRAFDLFASVDAHLWYLGT